MKSIMITAPSSGTGKTLITLGLIRALKNRGLNVSAFKTGPDFIDTKYLGLASAKRAGNLDMHMMGKEGLKKALYMNNSQYAVVEGAMGYFDGIYNTFFNSSYDISRELDINTILIYTPKGEMFSAIPKIKGMVDFQDSKIKGIILNKVRKDIYLLLKEKIEEYIGIKVLGYIEEDEGLEIQSRYLGLIQCMESKEIEKVIGNIARVVEKNIDIEGIINMMGEINAPAYTYPYKRNIKVAIAYDEAFSFYYNENLNLLENICQVEYFSPIKDKKIPQSDLLYLGGGYPELDKEELSQNINMRKSIKDRVGSGGYIYGEAGGFMYLVDSIEGYPMCGIFNGKAIMKEKLQRFGYVDIQLNQNCLLGKKGDILTGQEFHRSITEIEDNPLFNITKPKGKRKWQCGYKYKNVLGGYPHINFLGNMEAFNYLLDTIESKR